MAYWVYILRGADGTLYTGYTNNVDRRCAVHNSGRGAKYTRSRRPVTVVYRERCDDRSGALRREAAGAGTVFFFIRIPSQNKTAENRAISRKTG